VIARDRSPVGNRVTRPKSSDSLRAGNPRAFHLDGTARIYHGPVTDLASLTWLNCRVTVAAF
jgi:hypothetical protein